MSLRKGKNIKKIKQIENIYLELYNISTSKSCVNARVITDIFSELCNLIYLNWCPVLYIFSEEKHIWILFRLFKYGVKKDHSSAIINFYINKINELFKNENIYIHCGTILFENDFVKYIYDLDIKKIVRSTPDDIDFISNETFLFDIRDLPFIEFKEIERRLKNLSSTIQN